jgi:hypothetical protein
MLPLWFFEIYNSSCCSFAGVYDIKSHLEHEKKRGIDKISAMGRAMGSSTKGYLSNSPIHLIENGAQLFEDSDYLLDSLPRILILHGQKDTIVSMEQSSTMFNTIGKAIPLPHRTEVDVRMRLHKRMGHSEPVLGKVIFFATSRIFTKPSSCIYSINAQCVFKKSFTQITHTRYSGIY